MQKLFGMGFVLGALVLAGCSLSLTNTPRSELSTTPFVTNNAMANWKTYRSEKYGYEIKYPEYGKAEISPKRGEIVFVGYQKSGVRVGASVVMFPNLKNLAVDQWYAQYYADEKNKAQQQDTPFFLSQTGKSVQLNGYAAYTTRDFSVDAAQVNFYISHNKNTYLITYHEESIGNVPQWNEYEKIIKQILATFKLIKYEATSWETYRNENMGIVSSSDIDPASVVDAAWGIPALPSGFTWKSSLQGPRDRILGSDGKALNLPGKTYIHEYTDVSAPQWDNDVFAYYTKALARDVWQHSVTDAKGREFTAPAADGMLSGSVTGALQIQGNKLRAMIYWITNTSPKPCMEVPGDPPCPPQTYEQGVFISDPVPLNQIPGEAFKG